MFFLISWRNVWRNKKRSAVIIAAIASGIWAGLFSMGVSLGMYRQMVDSAVNTRLSHLQIHDENFLRHREIGRTIPDGESVLRQVRALPAVKAAAGRFILSGMANSPVTASGVEIYGIVPAEEKKVTDLYQHILTGSYFEADRKNPVLIGRKLAERLQVKLGNKIVLTAQAADGSLVTGAFRITGIFETVSAGFDEQTVFVLKDDVDRIFGLSGGIHEIAAQIRDVQSLDTVVEELKTAFPDLAVDSWKSLAPELAMTLEMGDQTLYIFLIIILLALVFGITNTMLMGVLERVRELGVVMALGLKPVRVFIIILLETVFLALLGGSMGILLGVASLRLIARTGINLSIVSEGLAQFGASPVVYPYLPASEYPRIVLLVLATALVSSVYPGIKAVKLRPAQAIRTY
jgi:ABC-type lipoprotein release transport system permease subunit